MSDEPCRSCGAPLLWAFTEKGRRMPVDPEPTEDGNVTLSLGGPVTGSRKALVWGRPEQIPAGVSRYTSHFATCPHAPRHRRTR